MASKSYCQIKADYSVIDPRGDIFSIFSLISANLAPQVKIWVSTDVIIKQSITSLGYRDC